MSKVIMSNGGFTVELLKLNVFQRVEGNTTNPCIRNLSCLLSQHREQRQTLTTHNTNRHCLVRFYTLVGQPLSC